MRVPDGDASPAGSAKESWRHSLREACAKHAALGPSLLLPSATRPRSKTMLPTITPFMTGHQLRDGAVGADAGMVSEGNRNAIEDAQPESVRQALRWATSR